MTATDWVLIIGAVFSGVVLSINAWGTHFGRKEAQAAAATASVERATADRKLDQIHVLTNSNLESVQRNLTDALARIEQLEHSMAAKGHTPPKDRRRKRVA